MIEVVYIDCDLLDPNPWNPNQMDDAMLRKEIESIKEFGFVDPITVRRLGDRYQIIDGEHRLIAAEEIDLGALPCIVLDVDDDVAEQLTIVLNDLRGKPDEKKLAALVRDLSTRRSMLDLERILPYKRERLAEMISDRRADFDWESLRKPRLEDKPEPRWIERVYRFPPDVVGVIDRAIGKARSEEDIDEDWRALELICADFVAGT